jgi:hypothetical protein
VKRNEEHIFAEMLLMMVFITRLREEPATTKTKEFEQGERKQIIFPESRLLSFVKPTIHVDLITDNVRHENPLNIMQLVLRFLSCSHYLASVCIKNHAGCTRKKDFLIIAAMLSSRISSSSSLR